MEYKICKNGEIKVYCFNCNKSFCSKSGKIKILKNNYFICSCCSINYNNSNLQVLWKLTPNSIPKRKKSKGLFPIIGKRKNRKYLLERHKKYRNKYPYIYSDLFFDKWFIYLPHSKQKRN